MTEPFTGVRRERVAALGERYVARVNGVRVGSSGSERDALKILDDHLQAQEKKDADGKK